MAGYQEEEEKEESALLIRSGAWCIVPSLPVYSQGNLVKKVLIESKI